MKSVIILAITFVLLIPINAFSISVSEIENKLLQAQSEEDIEQILKEIVGSSEYQQACKELFQKIKSNQGVFDDPSISEKKKEELVLIVQNYYKLHCNTTQNVWGDVPKQYSLTQCNELISQFDEYNQKYADTYNQHLLIEEESGTEMAREWLDNSGFFDMTPLKHNVLGEYHENCVPIEDECNSMEEELKIVYAKYLKLEMGTLEEKLFAQEVGLINDRLDMMCHFKNSIMQYYETQEEYFDIPIPTTIPFTKIGMFF